MPVWDESAPVAAVTCPLCMAGASRCIVNTVWDAPGSAVYQCDSCELVFLYPIMSLEEEQAFYEGQFSEYMRQRGGPGETRPDEHFEKNEPEADRRIANLKALLKSEMSVLEVGSSTGFMLAGIQPYVSSVTGIEPNVVYADYARQRGLKTCGSLDEVSERTFDLILAYYVLEHLRDPIQYLKRLYSMLNPNGMLALEVPNVDDALVRFYKLDSFDRFYWQKAHYFYYSHRTAATVLRQAGFSSVQVIQEHRYDFSNHLHWLLKGVPGGKGKYRQIFDEVLDGEYARCLKSQWLCDTVFALATK